MKNKNDTCNAKNADHDHDWGDILKRFADFETTWKGLATETIKERETYLNRFRDWLLDHVGEINLKQVNFCLLTDFIRDYQKHHSQASLRWMQLSLRPFLRFCHVTRIVPHDFSGSVPVVRKPRLSNMPKGLSFSQVNELLESVDRSKALGKRDYAILLLLASYGVRGIQVRTLTFGCIKWRQNQIVFNACKGGRPLIQPLLPNVGNCLVDYLQNSRPLSSTHNEIFLTFRQPWAPFLYSGSLSGIVMRYLQKAGIEVAPGASRGTHLFRHALAQRMLDHGVPFKNIADVLGHRDIDTTYIYTKIDRTRLQKASLEWPKVIL